MQIVAETQEEGTDKHKGPQYTATATATLSLLIYLIAHNYYARQIRKSFNVLEDEKREINTAKQAIIEAQEAQGLAIVQGRDTYMALLNHFWQVLPEVDQVLNEFRDTHNPQELPDSLQGLSYGASHRYIQQLNDVVQPVNEVDDESGEEDNEHGFQY